MIVRRNILTQYDTSNQSYYIFVPTVYWWKPEDDEPRVKKLWHAAFTSLGAAQAFFSHMGTEKGWYQEKVDGSNVWHLDLDPKNPLGAYLVTIHETLLSEN